MVNVHTLCLMSYAVGMHAMKPDTTAKASVLITYKRQRPKGIKGNVADNLGENSKTS